MKDTYLRLLLQIIKHKGSLDSLLNQGLLYSQIVQMINDATDRGFIVDKEGVLGVTNNGEKEINRIGKIFNDGFSTKWISPKLEERIDKFKKDDIYIPKGKLKL